MMTFRLAGSGGGGGFRVGGRFRTARNVLFCIGAALGDVRICASGIGTVVTDQLQLLGQRFGRYVRIR